MEYLGAIAAEPDTPDIRRERWLALIDDHPALEHSEPVEGINPFTRKPMLYHPPWDAASVIVDGKRVGVMMLAQDGSSYILVQGERHLMVPFAQRVAEILGSRFEEHRAEVG
jgi:hypothetical protein